ncbi:hypothetical protein HDU67_000598 [Dinochytrium kinnereticum]|nr:hypothetical protein HDU67_000598 [Dinochytrium kinnereticum]
MQLNHLLKSFALILATTAALVVADDSRECSHSPCVVGGALSCPDVKKVGDPYCDLYMWDELCVGRYQQAGGQCNDFFPYSRNCHHSVCDVGSGLDATCDRCAAEVISKDSSCENEWSNRCVARVETACGIKCADLEGQAVVHIYERNAETGHASSSHVAHTTSSTSVVHSTSTAATTSSAVVTSTSTAQVVPATSSTSSKAHSSSTPPPRPSFSARPSSTRPPPSSVRPPPSSVRPPPSSVRPPQSSMRPPQSSMRPPQSSVRPPFPSIRPSSSRPMPPVSISRVPSGLPTPSRSAGLSKSSSRFAASAVPTSISPGGGSSNVTTTTAGSGNGTVIINPNNQWLTSADLNKFVPVTVLPFTLPATGGTVVGNTFTLPPTTIGGANFGVDIDTVTLAITFRNANGAIIATAVFVSDTTLLIRRQEATKSKMLVTLADGKKFILGDLDTSNVSSLMEKVLTNIVEKIAEVANGGGPPVETTGSCGENDVNCVGPTSTPSVVGPGGIPVKPSAAPRSVSILSVGFAIFIASASAFFTLS